MGEATRIEGIGVRVILCADQKGRQRRRYNVADLQAAIEAAGREYRRRYGQPPTHVALPSDSTVALDALKLYTLNLAHPAGPGVVVVGRPTYRDGIGGHSD